MVILYLLAEYLHYPISNKNDLIKFLQQIHTIQLAQNTYQEDYVPGFGRKSFNRIRVPCIEGKIICFAAYSIVTMTENIFIILCNYCIST